MKYKRQPGENLGRERVWRKGNQRDEWSLGELWSLPAKKPCRDLHTSDIM